MSTSSNGLSTVLGSFGAKLGLVNTGIGIKNPDGTISWSGTLQGVTATALSTGAMIAEKSFGPAQFAVGAWGVFNVGLGVYDNYTKTGEVTVTGAQWASLAGNTVNMGMGLAKSTPVGFVAGTVIATGAEIGFNLNPTQPARTQLNAYNDPRSFTYLGAKEVLDQPYRSFAEDVAARKQQNAQSVMGQVMDGISLSAAITASETSNRAQAAQRAADKAAAEKAAAAVAQAAAAMQALEYAFTNSEGGGSRSGLDAFGGYNGFAGNTTPGSGWGMGEHGGMLAPIILDLGGDDIELALKGHSLARFDADDDGYAETTAWAGPKDGILVIDEGGDNQITQSKEIAFAKWTAAEDTDLQGLAATFDSNRDGVLDARDTRFADFKVWTDANSNGVVDAGEMQTLAQAGIKNLNLQVKDGTAARLDDGSIIHGLFDVQRTDGKTIQGADVALSYNSQGYRTRTDAQGNTLIEFESGGALHYRNMGALEGNASFNLGTDTDATVWIGASGNAGNDKVVAIKLVAAYAMNTRAGGRFGIWSRLEAANEWEWRVVA